MVEAAVSVIIPTYNAGKHLEAQLDLLTRQTLPSVEILVVDSSSTDDTVKIADSYGVQLHIIPKAEFDHGGTRTCMGQLAKGDLLVYLTQDALPFDDTSIPKLVGKLLEDDHIGAAFGRQIPYANATPFARHLRSFNYPSVSHVRTIRDSERYGMKTFFCSNSFAAYKRKALESVGWFKAGLLMAEDMYVCAKLLAAGYHVAYAAEAVVYHSHNYSVGQEFRRYFDLGAFFNQEQWILEQYGKANSEGLRFVASEVSYLRENGFGRYIPLSLLRSAAKWCGYQVGHFYPYLPPVLVRRLSMHAK